MAQARLRFHMRRTALALLAMTFLAGCGSSGGPAVTPEDRAAGAELHPQLLAEFGGAYGGDEAQYLARLGAKVAATAGLDGQCRFTLVNSDVVNAFAVPGCYIYVTRGLMGLVNSEAELGSVLAHELGHIVGRHAQRQQRRSLWRSLGVAAVQLLTGSERLTRIAGAAAGYFTLRYSRSQEFEADDLGLQFLQEAGYDPHASVDMLDVLARQEQFLLRTRGHDEARSIPEWARTHPLTQSRIERASEAAAATGLRRGERPEDELPFIRIVDGLLYGDDPEQGFVIGRRFAHPLMRIAFEAPRGFTLTNSPQAILIEGPEGMRGEFSGGLMPSGGLAAYTAAVLGQVLKKVPLDQAYSRQTMVNGLEALVTDATVVAAQERVALSMIAYAAGDQAFHFVMVSPAGSNSPPSLSALFGSFRLISEAEARSLRPRVIASGRAGPNDTLESLARQMAGEEKLAHFLMLNGRRPAQPMKPGEPFKIVRYATARRPAG